MFRIANKVFCSVFDDRNNTNVSWLANISNFFQKFKLQKILVVGLLVVWKQLNFEIWLTMKMDSFVVKKWNVKFYTMFRIANKVFCSVFDTRNNTNVSWLANILRFYEKNEFQKFSLWVYWVYENTFKSRYDWQWKSTRWWWRNETLSFIQCSVLPTKYSVLFLMTETIPKLAG